MPPLKVLRALSVFAIVPAAVAELLGTCRNNGFEFQSEYIVIGCDGSGGTLETNLQKVSVLMNKEVHLAHLPEGLSNFQAFMRTAGNADMYLRDAEGQRVDQAGGGITALPGGAQVTSQHTAGTPSTDVLKIDGQLPKKLDLILKNTDGVTVDAEIGQYYDEWSGDDCPWRQAVGCKPYDQAKYRGVALQYSQWLHSKWSSCPEAWQDLAVPHIPVGSRVPLERWPMVFERWPQAQPGTDSWGMFKYSTDGGVEAGHSFVSRQQFDFLCDMQDYQNQFIEPCCAKVRSAFTDQDDALDKLTSMAKENGRQRPASILWEICRTIPNVPDEFLMDQGNFFSYWHAGAAMVAQDLTVCYPNGRVEVAPTSQPLFSLGPGNGQMADAKPVDGKMPWEMDGSEGSPSAGHHHRTTTPSGTHLPGHRTTTPSGTHHPDHLTTTPSGTHHPYHNRPLHTGGKYPGVEDYPYKPIKYKYTTPNYDGAITIAPGYGHYGGADYNPSTSGPFWKGYAVAAAAGTAVAAATATGAVAITQIVKGNKGNVPPQDKVMCDVYMKDTGCMWTQQYNCPGQPATPQRIGIAFDDGSPGFTCCCADKLWEQVPIQPTLQPPPTLTPLLAQRVWPFRRESGVHGHAGEQGHVADAQISRSQVARNPPQNGVSRDVVVLTGIAAVCCCACCIGVAAALIFLFRKRSNKDTDIVGMQPHYFDPRGSEDQENLLSTSPYDQQDRNSWR
jgi:hypothetical protein